MANNYSLTSHLKTIEMDIFDVKILCDYTSETGKGCNGNLKGIGSLVARMKVKDVISRLEGIE